MTLDQSDYCEPCGVYHVRDAHDDAVPTPCGEVELQGYDTVLECARPSGHGGEHTTHIGQSWGWPR